MLELFKANATLAFFTTACSVVLGALFGFQDTSASGYAAIIALMQYWLFRYWCRKDEKRHKQDTYRTGNITITGDRRSVAIAKEAILQSQDEVI